MPTEVEKILWRIGACLITAVPLLFAVLFMVIGLMMVEMDSLPYLLRPVLLLVAGFDFFILPTLYLIARITLLVQPFLLLRALPKGAYITVNWTTFIPHI
jgi:hypothetical protein